LRPTLAPYTCWLTATLRGWICYARRLLRAQSRKSLCRQARIMGGLRVDVLRAHPLLDHPLLEPSQHFKCPHQDVGCTARSIASSAGARLHGLFDLLLDGFLVEARALCIGGKSIAVRASLATSCCTSTKRQNSNPPPIGCKDRLVVTGCRESLFDH
jgi:hypothetical protein